MDSGSPPSTEDLEEPATGQAMPSTQSSADQQGTSKQQSTANEGPIAAEHAETTEQREGASQDEQGTTAEDEGRTSDRQEERSTSDEQRSAEEQPRADGGQSSSSAPSTGALGRMGPVSGTESPGPALEASGGAQTIEEDPEIEEIDRPAGDVRPQAIRMARKRGDHWVIHEEEFATAAVRKLERTAKELVETAKVRSSTCSDFIVSYLIKLYRHRLFCCLLEH